MQVAGQTVLWKGLVISSGIESNSRVSIDFTIGTNMLLVSFSACCLPSFVCMSSTLSHPYSYFLEDFVSQAACLHLQSYCIGPTAKAFSPFQKYNKNHCQLTLSHKLCKRVMVWLEIIPVDSLNELLDVCTFLTLLPLRPCRIYLSLVVPSSMQLDVGISLSLLPRISAAAPSVH